MASTGKLIRLPDPIKEAILMLVQYVMHASGTEPNQEELARALKSYFTLDEVTNQLSYQRRKRGSPPKEADGAAPQAAWRFNMAGGPSRNSLARAGYFIEAIAEGIEAIRRHAASVLGSEPSDREIALSLKSSFILSELKNQILHARKQSSEEIDLDGPA
jgi:hypothetical protein